MEEIFGGKRMKIPKEFIEELKEIDFEDLLTTEYDKIYKDCTGEPMLFDEIDTIIRRKLNELIEEKE